MEKILFFLAAQTVGVLAMVMNVLSFQQKKKQNAIIFQLLSSILFMTNYIMLGATVGALLNVVGIFRAIVYMNPRVFKSEKLHWVFIFSFAFIMMYVMVFTVFGKEPSIKNLIIEILPVIAMILATISFRCKSAKMIRRFGMFSSPMWFVYGISNLALGAILCEILNMSSIIIGTLRFDIKKKNNG